MRVVGQWKTNTKPSRETRRGAAAGAAILCAALLGLAVFPAFTQPGVTVWPQFRGNPRLTGVIPGTALPATLKLAWTFEAGDAIESSAAIADGTVFVGTQASELIALDLASGAVKWRYKTKNAIGESSPAVGHGIVYVGDLGGTFHAVDARDGKVMWTFKTGSEIKSSPVVVGDHVLFGSYDQHFYAVNARTGAIHWKLETNGPVHATAAVADGIAYITGCDEIFRAIRVSDGKEVFTVPSGAYTGASPALVGTVAYYGTFNNDVLAVDLAAKKILWRYTHPERQFPYASSAAVHEGKVVVGGRDKMVHGIDAKTGKSLWTFTTRSRVESSPVITGGRVYVGGNDGKFYVLDVNTGAKVWEFEAGAPMSASPAVAGGSLVIGTQDGRLFCFR